MARICPNAITLILILTISTILAIVPMKVQAELGTIRTDNPPVIDGARVLHLMLYSF